MSLFMLLPMTQSNPISLTLAGYAGANLVSEILANPPDKPIVGVRLTSDGKLETALGDTSSGLSFSQAGVDYLINSTNGAAYEAKLTNISETGNAGTLVGTVGSWITLSSMHTWTWQKDTDTAGAANLTVDLSIREIAVPSNIVTVAGRAWVGSIDL